MIADASRRGSRRFPDIFISFESSKILLPPAVQFAAASMAFVAATVLCCLAVSRIGELRLAAAKEPAIARAEAANADLRDQPAGPRSKLALAFRDREPTQARMALLTSHTDPLRGRELRRNPPGRFRLAGLITADAPETRADPAPATNVISDAPPEPESDSRRVAEIGWRALNEFRRVLASTGLNVDRLFPQFGLDRAEGGPFIAPPKGDQSGGISGDKLQAMRSLLKSLPLSTPLDNYQLESRFGRRHDPFNRRLSFHTGIDLSAPYMSPVYATAAGIVTYAGYRRDYGRVVEIDHGNGISTLYAHLHRFIVSVGQQVAEHTQIGFLGSTGRSSGPHVHYEILVNDEAQDPEKFIGLAHLIPAAQK